MNEETRAQLTLKTNLAGAWCGFYYCLFLFLGWWVVGGFFPMHEPTANAETIAAFYRSNPVSIKAGMVLMMWAAAMFIPFTSTLADYVAQVEGRRGPLTNTTLLAGYSNAMLSFYPPLYWMATAFRADDRSPELLYLLNDVAWIQFLGGLSLVMPIYVVIATLAFLDKSQKPIFPRWLGYFHVLTFVILLPDQLLFFFKTGPFAWNGLLAFWIPVPWFCFWILVMAWVLRKHVLHAMHSPKTTPTVASSVKTI